MMAAMDFFGLTSKVEQFIDIRIRGSLEEFLGRLSARAKQFEGNARSQLRDARQTEALKFNIAYKVSKAIAREPWRSQFQYFSDYEREGRYKAAKKSAYDAALAHGIADSALITDDMIDDHIAAMMTEKDYLRLRSEGETIVSWIAIICLVLTIVTWSPVMLFFLLAYVAYFLFRGTFFTLFYIFIFLLGGSFFFIVRVATTLVLFAVVGPVVTVLHVIDKPPSGTMGSIGFALALASYGQEKFC